MSELKLFDAMSWGLMLFIVVGFVAAAWITGGKE